MRALVISFCKGAVEAVVTNGFINDVGGKRDGNDLELAAGKQD